MGINLDLNKFKDFKIYKQSMRCVNKLNSLGFKIFVVTNQPDVGRKIISKKIILNEPIQSTFTHV